MEPSSQSRSKAGTHGKLKEQGLKVSRLEAQVKQLQQQLETEGELLLAQQDQAALFRREQMKSDEEAFRQQL